MNRRTLFQAAAATAGSFLLSSAAAKAKGLTTRQAQWNDGSAEASPGTSQYPNLLDGYALRPAWQVPGVDYRAGLPTEWKGTDWLTWALTNDTAVTIRDSLNSAVKGGNFFGKAPPYTCFVSAALTIRDIDFETSTQGPASLRFSSNYDNSLVDRCNFGNKLSGRAHISTALNTIGKLTIQRSSFDGLGAKAVGRVDHIFSPAGGGDMIYRLNHIKNAPGGVWRHNYVNPFVRMFANFVEFSATGPAGAHNGVSSWGTTGDSTVNHEVDFNCVYCPPGALNESGLSDLWEFTVKMKAPKVRNNTTISKGPGSNSYQFLGGDAHHPISGEGEISNNYSDCSGLINGSPRSVFRNSFAGWKAFQNYDMATGNELPKPPVR